MSASRSLVETPRGEIIALALRELAEFFPAVKEARLEKAQVIKEVRATFSARPGLEQLRPGAATPLRNFFLAGDWTRSGWPATMEGAVRSGYIAAEAVCAAAGSPRRFLLARYRIMKAMRTLLVTDALPLLASLIRDRTHDIDEP